MAINVQNLRQTFIDSDFVIFIAFGTNDCVRCVFLLFLFRMIVVLFELVCHPLSLSFVRNLGVNGSCAPPVRVSARNSQRVERNFFGVRKARTDKVTQHHLLSI